MEFRKEKTASICAEETCAVERDDHASEAIGLGRIVSRAKFEDHLLLDAKVKCLLMAPFAQIPNMQRVTITAFEKNLGI